MWRVRSYIKGVLQRLLPNDLYGIIRGLYRKYLLKLYAPVAVYRARKYSESLESKYINLMKNTENKEDFNALERYFYSNLKGPGIWKWTHYFEHYNRHFSKYRGSRVRILEIGIYSGGSLGLWRDYFGSKCEVIGVDISEACKQYEGENIKVCIGDQGDRDFWHRVTKGEGSIDIVVDDGGHAPEQQIVTLESLLPHMSPGGVYVCEDVLGLNHTFRNYVNSLVNELNAVGNNANRTQKVVHSVHHYPYMVVIEINEKYVSEFKAEKKGSEWEPMYSE